MTNFLIVEDERYAAAELGRMMKRLRPDYMLARQVETVEDAVEFLRTHAVDLVLMDVRLGDGDCFDIFERVDLRVPIIFTTGNDEYAIRAFKVNSVDYLLKPVQEEELEAALLKWEQMNASHAAPQTDYRQLEKAVAGGRTKNRFLIRVGDGYDHVITSDAAHFYAEDKVVFLHTSADRRYIIDYTLDELEKLLDATQFFRVSRSCIVNIRSIRKISRYFNSRLKLTLLPACPQEVLVSRMRVADFLRWVDGLN